MSTQTSGDINITPPAYQELRQVVKGIDALFAEKGVEQPHYHISAQYQPKRQYFLLSPNKHDPSTAVLRQLKDDERLKALYRRGHELVGQHQLDLELTRHQFYLLGNRISSV
ncbi:MAG: hypothetical protein AABX13_02230 [Nanoarchaeota archaeon]